MLKNVPRWIVWSSVLFVGIPGWVAAVGLWAGVVKVHWAAAMCATAVGTIWATLFAQWLWRQGVVHRTYRAVHGTTSALASRLDFRAVNDRPLHVRGFMRVPEGQEPPDPAFRCTRSGARVKNPWRSSVPVGVGDLWAVTVFAYPGQVSGVYEVVPSKKIKTWGEQYSKDAESWHLGNPLPGDRYMRYREPTRGDLSDPIALRSRALTPEWLLLARIIIHGKRTDTVPVPAMKLSAVRELRIVFDSVTTSGIGVQETTFALIDRITPVVVTRRGTRLVCVLDEASQSATLVRGVGLRWQSLRASKNRTFAFDFILDPRTDMVTGVRAEGIAGTDWLLRGVLTVYFR